MALWFTSEVKSSYTWGGAIFVSVPVQRKDGTASLLTIACAGARPGGGGWVLLR